MTEETPTLPVWFWPALPVLFVGFWCGVTYLLGILSGWRRLAAHYAAAMPAAGLRFRFRSAKSGVIRYNHCLNFAIAPNGLHIWLLAPFRLGSPPLLVPWTDISARPVRELLFGCIALSFARAPGVRMRIATGLGEQIAAASRGALRIGRDDS
jgi:hypothetical protein